METKKPISKKVNAGAGGAIVGAGPVMIVVLWLARIFDVEMKPEEAIALSAILAGAGSWVAGYLKADNV